MPVRASLRVTRRPDLRAILDRSGHADAALRDKLFAAALEVEARAQGFIQAKKVIDTGRLQNSITTRAKWNPGKAPVPPATPEDAVSTPSKDFTVHVGTGVKYAAVHEYGNRSHPQRAYLRPAAEEVRRGLKRLFK